MLSPAMEHATATEQQTKITVGGPRGSSFPKNKSTRPEMAIAQHIVIPDVGLFEVPTNPAMYALTLANKKDMKHVNMAIKTHQPHWSENIEKTK
mmetsp:Transcript_11826/g.19261  ORF Transcript_11826/g.19261 Transcript_11826/m.19261 type:complete len:94 (+) Transcript_11826:805-1086(+)